MLSGVVLDKDEGDSVHHRMMLVLLVFATWLLYCLVVVFYRLTLHPLARFPGPKLAACSLWYEFYYDVVREGQWIWEIKRMHERYGPIVRINPHELHIKDSGFYQELYAPTNGRPKPSKYQWWVNMAGAPGALFATVDEDLHRKRRAPLDHFFSKKGVRELEPLIRSKVAKLSDRFSAASKDRVVVQADYAFMALTMDVICSYCFGADPLYLDRKDFGMQWKKTINGAWQKAAQLRAFPAMASIMRKFPRSLAMRLDPNMGHFLAWQDSVQAVVKPIIEHRDVMESNTAAAAEKQQPRTIFHTLRDSDLPPQERSMRRLCDEGEIFTGAGSETTAKTSSTILYYLASTPDCMRKLKAELRQAMPDPDQLASWSQLEKLPYLSAVIQEGLRLSYGITTRLPRVSPDPIQYHDWLIPARTPVSETPYFVLTDPNVFQLPEVFRPERWIEDGPKLDRYQVSFNKGSRSCIGINLAYAELYLTCAALYRRFNFELYETSFKDVEMVHDFFVAAPAKPHGGVRVKITVDDDDD